jgi:integrase
MRRLREQSGESQGVLALRAGIRAGSLARAGQEGVALRRPRQGRAEGRTRSASGADRPPRVPPHVYASLLVAAGYNLKEVMEFLGHADLQTTSRYVKRLPAPAEVNRADRLEAYLVA